MAAFAAGDEGDVLHSIDAVGDRRGAGRGRQADLPDDLAVGLVIGAEVAVARGGEGQAAARGQQRAGDRRALAHGPLGLARPQVEGLDAAELTVRVRHGMGLEPLVVAAAGALSRGARGPGEVGAVFEHRHVEDVGLGVVGGRQPVAQARRARTQQLGHARLRGDGGVVGLDPGLRIDGGDDVLQPHVVGEDVLAVGAVDGVEQGHLAGGDHQFARHAIDRHVDQ